MTNMWIFQALILPARGDCQEPGGGGAWRGEDLEVSTIKFYFKTILSENFRYHYRAPTNAESCGSYMLCWLLDRATGPKLIDTLVVT